MDSRHASVKNSEQQSVRCLAWLMVRCRPTAPYSTGDLDVANRDKLTEGPLLVSNSRHRPGGRTVGGSNPHLDRAGAERSSARGALEPARARPARQIVESATHVFVEPVDRALRGQIGRGFVKPFRRRVAIEAMYGARVNIARRAERAPRSGPGRKPATSLPVACRAPLMHQDRRLSFWDVGAGGPPGFYWEESDERRSHRRSSSSELRVPEIVLAPSGCTVREGLFGLRAY